MLSRVPPGGLPPAKHRVQDVDLPVAIGPDEVALARHHSLCGLVSVSGAGEVITTRATVAGYADGLPVLQCSREGRQELPVLRAQYVARGVRVLSGSRWRLNRFQERTIVLRTGAEPTLAVYSGDAGLDSFGSNDLQAETTYVLTLDTMCALTERTHSRGTKTPLATGIQLSKPAESSEATAFRLRIRFATAADAEIWCSIVKQTLIYARWSRDVRPVKQELHLTQKRNIRVVEHVQAPRRFVIKVLPAKNESGDCHELQILRRLYGSLAAQDVGLVRGYRAVKTTEEMLLIMPQLSGITLLQLLRQRRRKRTPGLKEEEVWRLLAQLANLLLAVHKTGIVHCDLNLDNVLVTPDVANVWLIDFGGAFDLLAGQNLSCQDEEMTGTPGYVAPERIQYPLLPPTPQADVFSLGILLFQALTGQHPYVNATQEKRVLLLSDSLHLDWHQAEELLTAHAVSLELRNLVGEMLASDPQTRASLDKIVAVAHLRT
ncbi:unnamed protein product [Phytophthora lilii]|uniref:Unnamed protein product n=1 Tax=Phytophthora lilii TaxID=2077276 RepID=A0A9W6X016_9STRA|nr:unnamed protein product [Phytophthora lilii]